MADPRFRDAARRFLIWRFGQSVHWECTYDELARATGLLPGTIRRLCRKYGYHTEPGNNRDTQFGRAMPVDRFIANNGKIPFNAY
jgi:hypothetical protein